MIPGSNGQPPGSYQISISGMVAAEVAALGERAKQEGWFEAYKVALLEIDRRLRADPMGFGELVDDLAALKLIVHVRLVPPLVVRFAIHQEERVVFLMAVFSLSH